MSSLSGAVCRGATAISTGGEMHTLIAEQRTHDTVVTLGARHVQGSAARAQAAAAAAAAAAGAASTAAGVY
jgi:hypothetical protein